MARPTDPGLYHIPREQGDMTRVVWPALALFLLIALASFWLATQWTAWRFGYAPALGRPMAGHLYAPWDIVVWSLRYDSPAFGSQALSVFMRAHAGMGVGGLLALILPVAYAYRRTRRLAQGRNDLHGSAHWASPEEVKASGLLSDAGNRGGVYLGAWEERPGDERSQVYLRHKGPEHVMVFAPTRSGKGVGIVIPTLLSWDESVLVHDIKGENWHLTAGYRRALGQRAVKFDPASPATPGTVRFNPLDEIRRDGNIVKDVQNIATMIVDPDGGGLNDHWAKTGFDLLTGVVLYVLLADDLPDAQRNLPTVQAILSDGGPVRERAEREAEAQAEAAASQALEKGRQGRTAKPPTGFQAVIAYIRETANGLLASQPLEHWQEIGWRTVAQAAQSFLNKAPNEASGVLSTALSFLSVYRDPVVAQNVSVSDLNLPSLMETPTSLYLVVPPSDKDRLKPLIRLIVNQVVRRLTERMDFDENGQGHSIYPHRLLLLIDEFPSLGRLDVFAESLAFIAGYGLKALLIVQDLAQLYAAYGREESIVSNCHVRVAYAPNKVETAEALSKMAGQATVSHTQRQYSGGRFAVVLGHVNTNEQIVQRPLLTADEAMRLPESDELVFVAGYAPILARKIRYYRDEGFKKRVLLAPGASDTESVV